jgi:hypothetical protein
VAREFAGGKNGFLFLANPVSPMGESSAFFVQNNFVLVSDQFSSTTLLLFRSQGMVHSPPTNVFPAKLSK